MPQALASTQDPASYEMEMQAILSGLLSLQRGEPTPRLPHEWTGLAGKVAEAFNQLLETTERRESPHTDSSDEPETIANSRRLSVNGWVLDRQQYQLYDSAGRSAGLTSGEFRMFEALMLSANSVLSRAALFDMTRQGKFETYDRVIDIQIARIRKKMEQLQGTTPLIRTIRGLGYMLCGDIRAV